MSDSVKLNLHHFGAGRYNYQNFNPGKDSSFEVIMWIVLSAICGGYISYTLILPKIKDKLKDELKSDFIGTILNASGFMIGWGISSVVSAIAIFIIYSMMPKDSATTSLLKSVL